MKIYIPPALAENDLKYPLELLPIIPFLSNVDLYKKILANNGVWNDGLYSKLLFYTSSHIIVNDVANCDIIILPFKYCKDDKRILSICNDHRDKQIVSFFCDDSEEVFDLPDNLILIRTSTSQATIGKGERIMPVIVPDHFPNNVILDNIPSNKTISYCGHLLHGRDNQIKHLENIYNNLQIIKRQGFWAPGINKIHARREYYNNMLTGSFALCSRGGGNFSYRFYEALSFGRIPILIDTDCELPFEKKKIIQWDNHIIRIPIKEFFNLKRNDFINLIDHNVEKLSPLQNRKLWQTYFSPEGYFENFYLDL